MNLIQITEQLKNPAVSVQQLMQYANNTNPQVPSYVALAEMQRRQSMQAPPQAPQQTVKDQLGASLMGLPSVAPGAAPQQPQQQTPQQPTPQPPTQQASQPAPEQVPMPQPKEALPMQPGMQPGMAGGGLATIPLNMHHDFASGGIIAFADGGYPEEYAIPEKITEEEAQARREKAEKARGIGQDPYAEAKRRYAELEAKQAEREKNAGSDRFWAGLADFAASGTKQFGESAGAAAKTMQSMQKRQEEESDTRASKMAELHMLWGKEQEAIKRAGLAADMGQVDKANAARLEAAKARQTFDQVKAQTTSAGASASQARVAELKEQREAEEQKALLPEKIKLYRAQALREGRPPPSVEETNRYMSDPKYAAAYDRMQSVKNGGKGEFTREDAMKLAFPGGVIPGMDPQDGINAANKIYEAVNKARAGGGSTMVTLPDGRSLSFPTAEAAAEFKKKAGIQ